MEREATYRVRSDWDETCSSRFPASAANRDAAASVSRSSTRSLSGGEESLERREATLYARIAQFEEIVRETKLEMARRQAQLDDREDKLKENETRLAEREERLKIGQNELTARETAFQAKLADFAKGEADYLERTENQLREEALLHQDWEEFKTRSTTILGKIREQKFELERLLSRIR